MSATIVNLAAIPPAPPIGGLATGGTSAAGMTANTPGVPLGNGGVPISNQPLPSTTPVVSALPTSGPLAVVDQYVIFSGKVYIYTAFPGGPNYWALDTTGSPSIRDIFANLGLYPAANYTVGTVFQAVDLSISYAVQNVGGTLMWIYYNGIYEAPLATIQALEVSLGPQEYRLISRASDYLHNWFWTGSAFSLTQAALIGFAGGLFPPDLRYSRIPARPSVGPGNSGNSATALLPSRYHRKMQAW